MAQFFHGDHDRLFAVFGEITRLGLGETWMVPTGIATIILLAIAYSPRFEHARERWIAWALVPGYLFGVVAITGLVADILKILVGRLRPALWFSDGLDGFTGFSLRADHWSLPSGHTTTVAALATALTYLWPRHVAAYAILVALVALSRVGLDEHYVSDTIAGAWLGIVLTVYLTGVLQRSGVDLNDAKAGVMAPRARHTWRERLFGF